VILPPKKAKSVEFTLAKLISQQSSQCFCGENDKICQGKTEKKNTIIIHLVLRKGICTMLTSNPKNI
jgi:hypothetical protein